MPCSHWAGQTRPPFARDTRDVALPTVTCLTAWWLLFALSPSSADAAPSLGHSERRVVKLINKFRVGHGRPRLSVSPRLNLAADRHSREMVGHRYFAHASANGASAASRVRSFRRARRVGENIAFVGEGTRRPARQVVTMWIHSPTHRAVLLDPGFNRIGVGRRSGTLGTRGLVYTADFESRR